MKVTVPKVMVRGKLRWRVRWREFGRVKRAFCPSRNASDTRAAILCGDSVGIRHRLSLVDLAELTQMLSFGG